MKKTKIIYPDGKILELLWKDNVHPAYSWLKKALQGSIQSVHQFIPNWYSRRIQAWCNEEGLLLKMKCNVPGMKAINWPEPSFGWNKVPEYWNYAHNSIFIYDNMSNDEYEKAVKQMSRWSPIVGPILIMEGWRDDEYDDEEDFDPKILGEENN